MSDTGKKRGNRGGGGGGPQKKSKPWNTSQPKDPSQKAIPANTWGMLLTCEGGKDKRAVDEARLLFEEAYARMGKESYLKAAPPAADVNGADAPEGGGGGGGKSVDALLAAEVAELKDFKKFAFRWHETGVNNTIFVAFPTGEGAPRPSEVAANVAEHVKATKQLPARFLLKLLPVEATCFVGIDEIKKLAEDFVPKHFPTGERVAATTFAVDMERRACSGLDHMQVVDAFAKAVPPPHKVNLGKPDATILVQLVRNVCAVAVAPRYKALCKYNVRVAAEPDEEGDAGKDGAGKQQEQQPQKPEQQQQQEQEGAEAAAGEEPAAVKDAAGEPAGGAAEGEVAAGGGEEAAG